MSAPAASPRTRRAAAPARPAVRRPGPRRPRQAAERRVTGWRLTAAVLAAAIVVFPLYWMAVTALSSPAELYAQDAALHPRALHWENFVEPLQRWPFLRWAANSLVIAVVSVVLTVVVNLAAGFAFAKLDFPLKNAIFLAIISTLMVPVQVIMVAQFQLVVDLGLVNTSAGVVLPRLAEAFGLFLSRQFFASLPDELLEAARVDGAGAWRTFAAIALPLSKPLVAVLVIFTFMWRWNEFAWPLVALQDTERFTLPIGLLYLQDQYGRDYGDLMAMTLLSILPMLLVFAVFQRYFVEGMARTGLK
ncbi:carbohydrate ABC transporter permease [Quadrisphaera sp. DSM 44207]|uniref:carbohydrate ABC transporter permease n=1 Tax=Quadrisphaera sp. DSM 44207 TaxID=1881057 RepID=UPI00087F7A06|nr:carbohydrate ABC transporter permease [Quadrisphaera sp. DSM 44207]SDQ22579.1 carbohydrate ABC transporter membrane protein 2, CUT1 family [Quadrisphaera sp. DSM 44207]